VVGVIIGIAVVALLGGLFAAGLAAGGAGNPLTVAPPSIKPAEGCLDACRAWDNARQMQCNAAADEKAARKRADAIRGALFALLALAGVLLGAAITASVAIGGAVASSVTIAGIALAVWLAGIAIAMFAAAATTIAAATFLAGQLVAADADAGLKANRRQQWDAEVARTRIVVNQACTLAEASLCLSRTAPC
jgi:hypothetical protein